MKRILNLGSMASASAGIVAASVLALAACSSDKSSGNTPDGSAGTGGSGQGTGGTSVSSGGSSSGGKQNTGGKSGGGGASGADTDASAGSGGQDTDAGNRGDAHTGGAPNVDAGPPLPSGDGLVIATATNYGTTGFVGIARPADNSVSSGTLVDGNAGPVVSGGRGFLLERSLDLVALLDATGNIANTVSVDPPIADGGTAPWLDPSDVVVVGHKAYVPLYNASRIAIIDLDTHAVTGSIDLSSYVESGDVDGQIETSHGFYDAIGNRVYFLAERIDTNPHAYGLCLKVPALLIAVDPNTDQVVSASGHGDAGLDAGPALPPVIPLQLVGPFDMKFDAGARRLLIADSGCMDTLDGGTPRVKHGVEAIDFATGTTSVVFHPTSQDYIAGLVVFSPTSAILDTLDSNFADHWSWLNLGTGVLGDAVDGVPSTPVADGANIVVGVDVNGAAPAVVRKRLTDGKTTVLSSNPWPGKGYFASGGVAILK